MVEVYAKNRENRFDEKKHADYVLNPFSAEINLEFNKTQNLTVSCPLSDYISNGDAKFTIGSLVIVDVEKYIFVGTATYAPRQIFSIYDITVNNDEVTFQAEPLCDRLARHYYLVDVRPENMEPGNALIYMMGRSFGGDNIFESLYSAFDTGRLPRSTAYYQDMNILEAIRGTQDNAMLTRWNVIISNDNTILYFYTPQYYQESEKAWTFQYGKDLTGLQVQYDGSAIVRWIRPKGYNGISMSLNYRHSSGLAENGGVWSPDTESEIISNRRLFAPKKCITFDKVKMRADVQQDEDTAGLVICDNQSQVDLALYNAVMEMYETEKVDKPSITISINVADLSKNLEVPEETRKLFKNKMTIGSIVGVYSKPHLVDTDVMVTQITYDCLSQEIKSLTLSNSQYDFFDLVNRSVDTSKYVYENRR